MCSLAVTMQGAALNTAGVGHLAASALPLCPSSAPCSWLQDPRRYFEGKVVADGSQQPQVHGAPPAVLWQQALVSINPAQLQHGMTPQLTYQVSSLYQTCCVQVVAACCMATTV